MTSHTPQPTSGTGASTQGVGSPISNEAYNVISALHAKLEGMEAYRKYAQSGGNHQIWQSLTQLDTQAVESLCSELERMVQQGKFRMTQPGQTGQTAQSASGGFDGQSGSGYSSSSTR